MGFIIKYNRFFNITFDEEGNENPLQGFRFFATSTTRQKLLDYNLVFRPRSNGFDVYYSASPVIPISKKIRFTFGFTNTDAGLYEKYGLVKADAGDTTIFEPGLYFNNLNGDGTVLTESPSSIVANGAGLEERVSAADTFKIYRQTFKVFDTAGENVPSDYTLKHKYEPSLQQTVTVKPAAGVDSIITTINSVDSEEDYIDKPGPYLLESDTEPPITRNIYLNDELGQRSTGGIIDIYWETAQNTIADAETGQIYKITFKPK